MRVYKPAGTEQIIIKRDEALHNERITSSYSGWEWRDNGRTIVRIIDKGDNSSWSKDTASIKNEAGTLVGDADAVETYLNGFIGS